MGKLKKCYIPILILVDIVCVNLAYITSLYFRFLNKIPKYYMETYTNRIIPIAVIYISCFYIFRLYKSLWIYAGIDEFMLAIAACIIGNILNILYGHTIGPSLPYSIGIFAGIFSTLYVMSFRVFFRIYRRIIISINYYDKSDYKRILVIGAGEAGVMIVNEIKNHPKIKLKPIGFIDDNKYKIGTIISGLKVLGNRNNILKLVKEYGVDEIFITISSIDKDNKKDLIDICKTTGCATKIVPSIYELINGVVSLNQMKPIDVQDLLGRETILLDNEGISEYLSDKTVLVTGGGGSIGSELCRQIAKYKPKLLLILDIYENNAYDLQNELNYTYPDLKHKVIIATVREKRRIEKIFSEYRPEVVFHAAAHKHVPLMEENPAEAIKNNVFGTLNTAEAAHIYGTEKFVLISTDKAVNPTNVMGASKRICEMIVQAMNNISKTEFVAVRFGNVLGSNGSVIPLFKKQIQQGGPITVTHKDITRYFMTIPEASQLVLQAGEFAKGGEIFVLDMGKPVKIYDLASDLIKLSGFEPGIDIEIEITGLRPGEKLYEELLLDEEGLNTTRHKKIFVGRPTFNDIEALKKALNEIRFIVEKGDKETLIKEIEELVPTYKRINIASEVVN